LKVYNANDYFMQKLVYTSPARRESYYFYSRWCAPLNDRKLTLYKKWKSGKNSAGRTVIWTRSSLLKKQKSVKINYNLRYACLGLIVSFKFIPFKNKLLSLIYFSNGSITYYLTTELHKFFSYIYYNKRKKKIKKLNLKNTFLMLFQIKKLSFISCIELTPGKNVQYIRSTGTKGKLIKIDKESHTVLVQLPSKIKKIFSYYSFASLSPISLAENKKYANTKSGYWRAFGVKPTVRGVAMNAVDHPHGGRTKTIKHPLTPWGKTTKFK
jgi:large subunit ribosomal protein L2